MLALNLIKQRRRELEIPAIQPIFGGCVERIDVTSDVGRVLLGLATGAAGHRQSECSKEEKGERTGEGCVHGAQL